MDGFSYYKPSILGVPPFQETRKPLLTIYLPHTKSSLTILNHGHPPFPMDPINHHEPSLNLHILEVPSGKLTKLLKMVHLCPFVADLPIKRVILRSYVSLPDSIQFMEIQMLKNSSRSASAKVSTTTATILGVLRCGFGWCPQGSKKGPNVLGEFLWSSWLTTIWWFPEIGLPLVIIHFRLGFSMNLTSHF